METPEKVKKSKLNNKTDASEKKLKRKRKATNSVEAFLTDVSTVKSKKKKPTKEAGESEETGKFEKGKRNPLNVSS